MKRIGGINEHQLRLRSKQNRYKVIRFILLFHVCGYIHLYAQSEDIQFKHLSIEDGLSQSSVQCILQDSKGFMWFGTEDGLDRYDGYHFKEYRHDPDNPHSLSHSFVRSLLEDSKGILWVGTERGLNRFDRQTERFTRFEYDPDNPDGIGEHRVFDIFEDHLGTIWIGTEGGGLDRFVQDDTVVPSYTFINYRNDPDDSTSLSANLVYKILEDRNGNLWIGTYDGVNRFDRESGGFTVYRHDPDDPRSISENNVWSICEDHEGYLWFGTYSSGVDRFDPETGEFINYQYVPGDPNSLRGAQVWTIYEDGSRGLWLGTLGGGLNRYNRDNDNFTHFRHQPDNPQSISHDQIASIYEDRSGLLWVGTFGGGLNMYSRNKEAFRFYRPGSDDPDTHTDQVVSSFYEEQNGIVWIGTYTGGLYAFDRRDQTFSHYRYDPDDPNSLPDNAVRVVTGDSSDHLWIGTVSGVLSRFDIKSGQFVHYWSGLIDSSSQSRNPISDVCIDNNRNIWVATWGGGMYRLDPVTGRFAHYRYDPDDATSLSTDVVTTIYEDTKGVIWAGTNWGGLNKFNQETNAFTRYTVNPENRYGLSHAVVLSMYMDTSGILWVGTQGGLNRVEVDVDRFTHYRERDGLPSDFIHGILEDNYGNLWIATPRGLTKFDPRAETFKIFDIDTGSQDNYFFITPCSKLKNGEMLFGARNGFTLFHPDSIHVNQHIPPVVVTEFRMFNWVIEPAVGSILPQTISETDTIILSYNENVISFEFAALDFTEPKANRYAYMLSGLNADWVYSGNRRFVNYSNLPSGDYMFRVKGSNSDGVWNEEGTSIRIIVHPPWWDTWWAYVLYVLTACGLVFGLVRFEKKREREKALVREAELRAQAAEAEARAIQAENERKTRELEEARKLQLSMLPKEMPDLPNLEIAVYMNPATEVGGDYYDFHMAKDGTFTVAIGDATGHGMKAGNMVVSMKSLFNTLPDEISIPDFFNQCTSILKNMHMEQLYMCLAMARIKGNKMNVSTAGMPPLMVYRDRTKNIEEIGEGGIPLGWIEGFNYDQMETNLFPGDTVLLMTDGLAELFNEDEEMLDYPRIKELFQACAGRTPQAIITHLTEAGQKWSKGRNQQDDITFVVLKVKEADR